ncbi:hypothetical protein O0I10_011977 [Lichtheimia ornata]|uniref:Uncharacterized protein n=1 Tax=Lichtheimia ornata TaxID=688661 RepID=A0AAD7UTK9_9FUNG|nr:uncharacterized protein O0I10_011977 [Lichtheimia ornata]KAJ8652397.1 hypothetical protein O0I10_011977 [Lichtheimia ornata]
MATIVDIAWSELLKNTNLTAQHGNDGNRIATATETLQQAVHHFAKVLNDRAKLLANSAQFDAALRDAAAIRALLPRSGIGYLTTGDVYCQQGHHAAAITIYDQGLEAVPESDPCHQQLQQQRMTAIANNNKRIDFISRLPLDIVVTNIIPRVQCQVYCDILSEYLYVSRAWQERFLKQPNGLYYYFGSENHRSYQQANEFWHHLFSNKEDTFKMGYPQLGPFAPYIQSLRVPMGDILLDDLFSRVHFSNLRVLDIHCHYSTPRGPILSGLQMVASTLTRLEIVDGYCLGLRDILESCPNLVSLTTDGVNATMPLSTSYPKMKHLSIHRLSRTPLAYDTVANLLSRLPSLLSFDITPMPDSRLLTILYDHCPYLQRLNFGGRSFSSSNAEVHPSRKGITLAHLNGYGHSCMQGYLIQFLITHQSSLETFGCDSEFIRHEDALWDVSSDARLLWLNGGGRGNPTHSESASFTRLANIRFSEGCSFSCGPFIAWMVKNAPNLKTISLIERHLQPIVAIALIKSKHLSKIEITRLWEDDDIFFGDFEGILEFFQHHISMGDRSTLQEVTLHTGLRLSPEIEWIRLIPRLKCLKNLELLAHFIPEDCIPLLEAIGKGCPALEKLTLGKKDGTIGGGLMKSLREYPNLKCLHIQASALSDNDLVALTTFPSLEQLYLQCDVPDFIMKSLHKRIHKVIIK